MHTARSDDLIQLEVAQLGGAMRIGEVAIKVWMRTRRRPSAPSVPRRRCSLLITRRRKNGMLNSVAAGFWSDRFQHPTGAG
ncbi:hypothetical protein KCP77_21975 [Salmonella enterica subsp. enterica]|nr:hypothetical protein KCP77_21975 [Salmonella enterica subsp. enterica]